MNEAIFSSSSSTTCYVIASFFVNRWKPRWHIHRTVWLTFLPNRCRVQTQIYHFVLPMRNSANSSFVELYVFFLESLSFRTHLWGASVHLSQILLYLSSCLCPSAFFSTHQKLFIYSCEAVWGYFFMRIDVNWEFTLENSGQKSQSGTSTLSASVCLEALFCFSSVLTVASRQLSFMPFLKILKMLLECLLKMQSPLVNSKWKESGIAVWLMSL